MLILLYGAMTVSWPYGVFQGLFCAYFYTVFGRTVDFLTFFEIFLIFLLTAYRIVVIRYFVTIMMYQGKDKKMKVKRRVVVVADVVCDEDFDTTELMLAQDMNLHYPASQDLVGHSEQFVVADYLFQQESVLIDEIIQD